MKTCLSLTILLSFKVTHPFCFCSVHCANQVISTEQHEIFNSHLRSNPESNITFHDEIWQKEPSPIVLTGLTYRAHSRMQSLDCSVWRLWAAVFRPWPGSPLLRTNLVTRASAQATILTPNFKWTSYRHETRHGRTPNLIPSTDPSLQSSWITEARHYLRLIKKRNFKDWCFKSEWPFISGISPDQADLWTKMKSMFL